MTGITPAHAGKSGAPTLATAATGDHPRVCGEKISQTRRNLPLGGSPPRVRGKVDLGLVLFHLGRITPACAGKVRVQAPVQEHRGITPAHAGKRPGWADSGCQRGDHPCVCGEKIFEHPVSLANQGSLPRVRGKDYR